MYQTVATLGLIYALAVDAGPNSTVNVFEDDVANLETPRFFTWRIAVAELHFEDILRRQLGFH